MFGGGGSCCAVGRGGNFTLLLYGYHSFPGCPSSLRVNATRFHPPCDALGTGSGGCSCEGGIGGSWGAPSIGSGGDIKSGVCIQPPCVGSGSDGVSWGCEDGPRPGGSAGVVDYMAA